MSTTQHRPQASLILAVAVMYFSHLLTLLWTAQQLPPSHTWVLLEVWAVQPGPEWELVVRVTPPAVLEAIATPPLPEVDVLIMLPPPLLVDDANDPTAPGC
jgi:hypothetical protein